MIRTQVSFDKQLYENARRSARRRGVSLAELCRQSLAETIAQDDPSRPWMKYAGTITGDSRDSQSVDAVVHGRAAP